MVLNPHCSLEAPGRGIFQTVLKSSMGTQKNPCLKGTQASIVVLQGSQSVVINLGCILESQDYFLKDQWLGLIPIVLP